MISNELPPADEKTKNTLSSVYLMSFKKIREELFLVSKSDNTAKKYIPLEIEVTRHNFMNLLTNINLRIQHLLLNKTIIEREEVSKCTEYIQFLNDLGKHPPMKCYSVDQVTEIVNFMISRLEQ